MYALALDGEQFFGPEVMPHRIISQLWSPGIEPGCFEKPSFRLANRARECEYIIIGMSDTEGLSGVMI